MLVSKVVELQDVEHRAAGEMDAMKTQHAGDLRSLVADNSRLKFDNGTVTVFDARPAPPWPGR